MDSLDKKCAKRIIKHFKKENAKIGLFIDDLQKAHKSLYDGYTELLDSRGKVEDENAKLKAQQLNTRLGLEKLEKLITKDYWLYPVTNNEGDLVSLGLMDPTGWEEHLSGKTLADLIAQVELMEVE